MSIELRTKATVKEGIAWREDVGESTFIEYAPGNGTAYRLLITRLDNFAAHTAARIHSATNDCAIVSDLNGRYRSMIVGNGPFIHHGYIQDKMGYAKPDAIVLAELLGWMLDIPSTTVDDHLNDKSGSAP